MALPIEGFSVVVKLERIQALLDNNAFEIPNATELNDKHIWRCSFMAEADARDFLETLKNLDLNVSQGPDSDAVLISEFDRSVDPYCEWLQNGSWEKAVVAWREGTRPETVIAREGWDPKVGSGLVFHDPSQMQYLQFVRLEENIEVFLNTKTGQEVFMGRTSTPVDALFKTASGVVQAHFIAAGQPALTGEPEEKVSEAAGMLEKVIAEQPDWWNAQWFYGKSQLALGKYETAYEAFRHAYALEKNVEAIPRELAGVCMEVGKFDESADIAEAAVALEPDNPELLCNLALSYLLAGRLDHAEKAIAAAIKIDPDDSINQTVGRLVLEVREGRRPAPQSLSELSKPAQSKKKSWFKFPWW